MLEIALYALTIWALVRFGGLGTLGDSSRFSFDVSLYFSAETYTSLGYGDVVPGGAVRLLAGVEALNGLLLIGWSAAYTYLAMERFWSDAAGRAARQGRPGAHPGRRTGSTPTSRRPKSACPAAR